MTAAVFLDRDNTLIHNDGDLGDPSQVRLIQGAASAIASLKGLGYRIIVVTNQGGVARGKYTEADVDRVNERINDLMKANSGVFIDRFYYCPYHPEGTVERYRRDHPWRKPRPGMLLQAARDLGLDLRQSWMIGDQVRDVQAGFSAGAVPILLSVEGVTPPPMPAAPPALPGAGAGVGAGAGEERGGAGKTVLIEPARDYFVVRSLVEAVRLVGQKSRPTNVTAAMKTERIEVVHRQQPRVATASFDVEAVAADAGRPASDAAGPNDAPSGAATKHESGASEETVALASATVTAAAPSPAEIPGQIPGEIPVATRRKGRAEKLRLVTDDAEPAHQPAAPAPATTSTREVIEEIEATAADHLSPQRGNRGGGVDATPALEAARDEAKAAGLPKHATKPTRVPPSKRRGDAEEGPAPSAAEKKPEEAAVTPVETSAPAASIAIGAPTAGPAVSHAAAATLPDASSPSPGNAPSPSAEQTLRQILQELRSQRKVGGEFTYVGVMAIVLQMVAIVCVLAALLMGAGNNDIFLRWIACAIVLQLATLAMLLFRK